MTNEELRAINDEVHEKVMGHKPREVRGRGTDRTVVVRNYPAHCSDGEYWIEQLQSMRFLSPAYSTEIEEAWLVVKWLHERFELYYYPLQLRPDGREWECKVAIDRGSPDDPGESVLYVAREPTAPLAICRAALMATKGS